MMHGRHGQHDATVRSKATKDTFQKTQRVTNQLQHPTTHDHIDRLRGNVDLDLLHVAVPCAIKNCVCGIQRMLIDVDAEYLTRLTRLDRPTQCSIATTDV
jgi:hypothetical protein